MRAAPTCRAHPKRPLAAALLLGLGAGCGGASHPPVTPPSTLCAPGEGAGGACREPEDVERLLSDPDLEILGVEAPPSGAQGVRVLTLASKIPSTSSAPVVFRAKWRSWSTAEGFSSPRKEVAAYALQRLLFDPRDGVVPPTRVTCFPLAVARRHLDAGAQATWPDAPCEAGTLAYWLEGSRSLEDAADEGWLDREYPLDERLFDASEPYRRSVADVNLLTHLASHGDSHRQQFVVTGSRGAPRLFLVDNSIAFGSFRNPDLKDGPWDWSNLHVPRLRRASVDRARALTDADLDRLAVAEQLVLRGERLIAAPPGPPGKERDRGERWVDGAVQIGLDRAEITRLRRRLHRLIADVDAGRIATF